MFKNPQCFKITEKVSFNIASEASYVYILSGQKFIKSAKNLNSVTRQDNFNRTKIGEKCRDWKSQMRQFMWFSNTVCSMEFMAHLQNYWD